MSLTQDGALLCRRTEEIVALMDKTERELTSGGGSVCGEVATGGTIPRSALQAAAALRREHPGVRFHFHSGDARAVEGRLKHGSLDFAAFLAPVESEKYHALALQDVSQWGLLVAAEGDFADTTTVSREDLCRTPLVMHGRVGLQQAVAQWAGVQVEQPPSSRHTTSRMGTRNVS